MLQQGGFSMRTRLGVIAGAVLLAASTLMAQTEPLKVGDKAPDFTLPDQAGNKVSLSQFLGKKNVVLAFYVLAFTGG
jgi:peroxiredoxin Q/BCP